MLRRHALGHVLRHLRLEQGKTLRQLAQQSSISLPYLSEIERGRKEASSEILAMLCRVLDVSLGSLPDDVSNELTRSEFAVRDVTSIAEAPRIGAADRLGDRLVCRRPQLAFARRLGAWGSSRCEEIVAKSRVLWTG